MYENEKHIKIKSKERKKEEEKKNIKNPKINSSVVVVCSGENRGNPKDFQAYPPSVT